MRSETQIKGPWPRWIMLVGFSGLIGIDTWLYISRGDMGIFRDIIWGTIYLFGR